VAKVALLIGVSEYQPGLNPLPGSVLDVDALREVLVHPEMGGFAETDVFILKNPQRQEMEDQIYRLFANRWHWYRLARSYKRCNTGCSRNQANLE
jgi:hypothetical protein